jgi:hypothetical protein
VRDDLGDEHRWRQGWVHEIKDPRKPKRTEALMETYNARLLKTGALTPQVSA